MEEIKTKKPRGFAALSPEKRLEIARKGGANVPKEKRAFSQNKDLASKAGMLGGVNVPPEKRSYSQDRQLASVSGRKGGKNSQKGNKDE